MLTAHDLIASLSSDDPDVLATLEDSFKLIRQPTPPLAEDAWRHMDALGVEASECRVRALSALEQTPESILRVIGLGKDMKRNEMLALVGKALWRLPLARVAEVLPLVESAGTLAPEDRERLERRLKLSEMTPEALWAHALADHPRLMGLWPDTDELEDIVDALAAHPGLADTALTSLRSLDDPNETLLADLCLRCLGRWRREEAVDEAALFLEDDDISDGLFESCIVAVRDTASLDALARMSDGVDDKPVGYMLALTEGLEAIRTPESVALARHLAETSSADNAAHFAIALATMGCTDDEIVTLQLSVMDDPDIDSVEERELIHAMLGALAVAGNNDSLVRQLQARLADLRPNLGFSGHASDDEDYVDDDEPAALPDPDDITMPIVTPKKVGRNDPCPCGSGKKYKKCCAK